MSSVHNTNATNMCTSVWRNECCVINLSVITTFVSLWGAVLLSNPSLYPCSFLITSLWPLYCVSPNSWLRLSNNKQHMQSSNTPYCSLVQIKKLQIRSCGIIHKNPYHNTHMIPDFHLQKLYYKCSDMKYEHFEWHGWKSQKTELLYLCNQYAYLDTLSSIEN